ncbi:low-affinity zinc ion transporter-like protein [Lophiostoma macrostomum CBS 122681]|uniref:Low-affinity zinc ion transporter-like protein n=1 Tax=Lophiostoma macrostomum CBS 122681 TaxID=1314788 RepID=A0A6A6T290_9PLEO|nr:low-affinity zinc ion transporter-like protein [Lophiostoma macrostomum CBS 122681]
MVTAMDLARLLVRQADDEEPSPGNCISSNEYDGRMGVRISSVFVILIGSTLGAVFPIFAKRNRSLGVPDWAFFIAKYFGSGVIVATAFIHLLAPANEALGNPCLEGVITKYPWPEGIALMTIFVMFFLELMTMRYASFGEEDGHGHSHSHSPTVAHTSAGDSISLEGRNKYADIPEGGDNQHHHHTPGDDHLGHSRDHRDNAALGSDWEQRGIVPETYAAQLTAIFILEFGVIFHSIFVGLTLAVAGSEFITLYIVLVFHQTFEGLGLGARLASVPWPKSKRWTPYFLGLGYGVSTPIAIAIGLGVRKSYPPESETTLYVNGVFDSISAGILIYTGLVELMAHEFMFSPYMQKGPVSRMLSAFFLMCLGAGKYRLSLLTNATMLTESQGLMALLGYWA